MASALILSDHATSAYERGTDRVQPPTSGFRLERDMVQSARNWLTDQGFQTKSEFYTPWGVCDLVAVSFKEASVRQRLALGQK